MRRAEAIPTTHRREGSIEEMGAELGLKGLEGFGECKGRSPNMKGKCSSLQFDHGEKTLKSKSHET